MNYDQLFKNAAKAEGLDGQMFSLADSIFAQESGKGRNTKTSNQGAVGGMQIIPSTFKGYADKGWDINNPEHNTRAAMRLIKDLANQFGNNPGAVAAAYYGGPKAGKRFLEGGEPFRDLKNPNAPSTNEYAASVVSRMAPVVTANTTPQVGINIPQQPVLSAVNNDVIAPTVAQSNPISASLVQDVPVIQQQLAQFPASTVLGKAEPQRMTMDDLAAIGVFGSGRPMDFSKQIAAIQSMQMPTANFGSFNSAIGKKNRLA